MDAKLATLTMMRFRTLCGVFSLLLFVAPLSASFCGNGAPGHCMLTSGAPGMTEPGESGAEGHCQEAERQSEESAPCQSTSSGTASSACCSMAAAPEPENAVVSEVSIAFEDALFLTPRSEPALTDQTPTDDRRQPLQQAPLYALHCAILT